MDDAQNPYFYLIIAFRGRRVYRYFLGTPISGFPVDSPVLGRQPERSQARAPAPTHSTLGTALAVRKQNAWEGVEMARFLIGATLALLMAAGWAASLESPEIHTLRIAWRAESGIGTQGRVSVSEGKILRLLGWGLRAGDAVGADWSWQCDSGAAGPRSLLVTLSAPRTAAVQVTLGPQTHTFPLADLAKDDRITPLDGPVAVELLPTPRPLSGERESDIPALASSERAGIWCGWIAFDGREDQIFLAQLVDARWESRGALPRARGKIDQLALAATPQGNLIAVWGQERQRNWDLYASVLSGGRWSRPSRVTRNPGPDTNPRLASDTQGRVWLAWQSFEGSFSHIRLAYWEEGRWSPHMLLTDVPANHWAPALAVSPQGTVHVAWDSYASGSYDLYLRSFEGGQLTPIRRITHGPEYEANASLACGPDGRLWIAYDLGEADWGSERHAAELHRERRIGLRCLEGERLLQPPLPPTEALEGIATFAETPSVHVDSQGSIWIAYRRALREGTWDVAAQRFDGRRWSRPILLPDSAGRSDMQAVFATGENGHSWLAWASDGRDTPLLHHAVYAASLPRGFPAKERLDLEPVAEPAAEVSLRWEPRKRAVATFGEEGYSLYQGDLQRYTELSPCHPFRHGSIRDVLRFALDHARLDFLALDGVQSGASAGEAYRRRLQHKVADLYSVEGSLAILCSYNYSPLEGSHRSLLCLQAPLSEVERNAGAPGQTLRADEHPEGSLLILHGWERAPASGARPVDLVAPFAESTRGTGTGAPMPESWKDAWWLAAAGRAGLIASSGHQAGGTLTHLWAGYLTRERVLHALRLRHTYVGPTGVTIRFTAAGKPIGSVVPSGGKPVELAASIAAGVPILRVELLRNGERVQVTDVDHADSAEVAYTHPGDTNATHAYALRMLCADGTECWTTPIWVTDPSSTLQGWAGSGDHSTKRNP